MNKAINSFLMGLFLLPSGLYRRIGVDIPHLRTILVTKLMIDDRTATGWQKMRQHKDGKETNTATMITMVLSLIMGLLFTVVFIVEDDLTRLTLYLSVFGFMLAMFLITDFSHILVDVKDNYIILPRPVTAQTFLVARLLHILIHVSKILIPLALPACIAMWISRGIWGAVVLLLILALLTMLTFFLVNVVYLLIMQLFSPSKINSIITSMQIALSIILYGGYQLVANLLGKSFLEQLDLHQYIWMWIFPSYWMAAGWSLLYTFSPEPVYVLGAILSLVVPMIGCWLMVRFLAPAFLRKLSMISGGSAEADQKPKGVVNQKKSAGFSTWFAGIYTSKGIERASFLYAWKMTNRNRDFKLKVYPQIGYLVIIMILFIFRSDDSIVANEDAIASPGMKFLILMIIYLSSLLYMSAIAQIPYHEKSRASWLYLVPPVHNPGPIFSGTFKVLLVKFLLLPFLILVALGVSLLGPGLLPTLICGFGNVFLLCALYSWLWVDRLPFSVAPKKASENQSTYRNLALIIGLPLMGIPQYFLFPFPIILCLVGTITFSAGWIVLRYTKGIGWGQLKEA